MLFGGIAFLIGDVFAAKGNNWYNYIDNVAILSMITLGALYLKKTKSTEPWFDYGLLFPILLFNISLIIVGIQHPGHTINAISGMLLVLALINNNQKAPKWSFKYIYISYAFMILYAMLSEHKFHALAEINPKKFYIIQFANFLFFIATVLFRAQVGIANSKAFNEVKSSFESIKAYDVNLLNAVLHNVRSPASMILAKLQIAKLSNQTEIEIKEIAGATELISNQLLRVNEFTKTINTDESITLEELRKVFRKFMPAKNTITTSGDMTVLVPHSMGFAVKSFISNALSFAALSTVSIAEENGDIVIKIIDKGNGIPPFIFSKIGSEFISKPGLIGMGLNLSTYLIKRNQWYLQVGSSYGRGTDIVISNFPLPNRAKEYGANLYKSI